MYKQGMSLSSNFSFHDFIIAFELYFNILESRRYRDFLAENVFMNYLVAHNLFSIFYKVIMNVMKCSCYLISSVYPKTMQKYRSHEAH